MSSLQTHQYRDSSNFSARVVLHYRFSTNKYPWPLWVFDRFRQDPGLAVMELGCGNGYLWRLNAHRIPPGWRITLTDFSSGMLDDARRLIDNSVPGIAYEVADAGSIPRDDGACDIVIANHMLYHVPDRKKALSEIRRVLKKDGVLYATTMHEGHMGELRALIGEFRSASSAVAKGNQVIRNFSIENGADQLREFFPDVRLDIYENSLVVNEAAALVDYAFSLNCIWGDRVVIKEEERDAFTAFVKEKLAGGSLSIPADAGLFTCRCGT